MIDKIDRLIKEFEGKADSSSLTRANILNLKSEYLGKQGKITELLKSLKAVTPEERRLIGPKIHQAKAVILKKCEQKLVAIETKEINAKLEQERIDLELTNERLEGQSMGGGFHPRTLVQREIEDIFLSMGFDVLDGPHIDDEFHNFEALNIPADHPARDMQDTFRFEDNKSYLLRTHTSTLQVRGMLSRKPPFRFIAPGLVFRNERTDASHESAFCQLEGMLVDKDISVAHLIYFMKTMLSEIFQKEMKIRLRPGFFPFVEPGFELDILCDLCGGDGCKVCKYTGWLELLPCGMIHPNVLVHGKIDPEKWNGFAFGLGLDRLVMMKYRVEDIRLLTGGDLRFHSLFRAV